MLPAIFDNRKGALMYQKQGSWIFSPSDLSQYLASPFASWMNRLAVESPAQTPPRDPADPLLTVLQERGYAHEAQLVEQWRVRGHVVEEITGASDDDKFLHTQAAMRAGCDVIVQARLQLSAFAGYADFLAKTPGPSALGNYHYSVWDAKLSGAAKPSHLVQLCCYAEMLAALQGVRPASVAVVTGDGQPTHFRTDDYFYYYQSIKQAFLLQQNNFDADQQPDPADSESWGDWSEYASAQLIERDHLFQVANISRGQIKKLQNAGIASLTQLATSALDYVSGMQPAVLAKLKAQAAAQQKSQAKQAAGDARPWYQVLVPATAVKQGLALLPPHSTLDVFFDIEGFPLVEGGLEYLWGCSYFDDKAERQFIDFWAHDAEQEKHAFKSFIEWVYARWQQDPSMHIYHYANYEIAACRKLMGRYGVCEHQVDQLLRNEVFVDLYKIVKGGLLLGEPRYSIKNVEHLYRGKRETEVGTGGDSVVVYERWRERHQRGEEGGSWQTSAILKSIRDYNIDDCDSTQELVDWLRLQQKQHNINYLGAKELVEQETPEEVSARLELRDSLLAQAQLLEIDDAKKSALLAHLGWSLEFHRREAKPVFWRLFDRLGLSELELHDDLDCLSGCERTDKPPFKATSRARNLTYEYRFDPQQEFKGAAKNFYILGTEDDKGKPLKAALQPEFSELQQGIIALQCRLPLPDYVALVPDEYVHPDPIPQALEAQVRDYVAGKLDQRSAIIDFLARAKPRIKGASAGAIVTATDPAARLQQVIDAVVNLDNSCLTIQGPPGAGKSYTGKHVIATLVQQGARVGIASNSHKAINNLLLGSARYCRDQNIAASFACTKNTEPEFEGLGVSELKNSQLAEWLSDGCVVGTTAWGFAREDMASELDYLFIDEAGQVSVANLIAMSRSARNLVLMGDQMQLGQPSQGVHPAESGASILDYLLHDSPTIGDDMGVFLGTTFRMHSALNKFISEQIYAGKLNSAQANDRRIIEVPEGYSGPLDKSAGLVFEPVIHVGNTQVATEEVARIVTLATQLLGRSFHTGNTDVPMRPLGWDDMLFVAPYNLQVRALQEALGPQAKVGSVDRFQGQEAAVVFLSLCASDANESPRGLDFLFDRHRINVAVSRAQSLAVVVGNPALAQTRAHRVDQIPCVNLLNALVSYAG